MTNETVSRRDLMRRASLAVAATAASLSAHESGGHASALATNPSASGPGPARGLAKRHLVVAGAGVFGAFTALALRDRGHAVTLLDPWGPGNSRASSGGETRVIRAGYGERKIYTELAVEAFERWAAFEKRTGRRLLTQTGAMWLVGSDDSFVRNASAALAAAGLPKEELSIAEAARRWPQVRFDGLSWVFFEPLAGFLLARQACAAAVEAFVAAGGEVRAVAASGENGGIAESIAETGAVRLADGSSLDADAFVFACGPWLGQLFPDRLEPFIVPTRQDVLFFGPPRDDRRFDEGSLPVWIEHGEHVFYGIPGNERRGFKVADDTHGPRFDPTSGERQVSAQNISAARDLLARRFPGLTGAPLVETRVCQYESTPDAEFVLDRLDGGSGPPLWVVGGGSGHGFKFGPAWGERVAATVLGERAPEPRFELARFERTSDTRPVRDPWERQR